MPPPKVTIGIIGKANVGKSTFFMAATMVPVAIENRPFVTLEPNTGIGYVRKRCIHTELGLPNCNARNSFCIRGERFIPVVLVDVPGLVKGAHKGRGLGNRFLDAIRQAEVIIHVVDASGSTDEDGRYIKPGYRDPIEDVIAIEQEYEEWMYSILSRDWSRFARALDHAEPGQLVEALTKRLSGLSIRREHVAQALKLAKLESSRPSSWREEELREFIHWLRIVAKPMIIAANKIDIPEAKDLYKRMVKELKDRIIIPVTALGELILRKAAEKNYIDYLPGDPEFRIKDPSALTLQQRRALELVANVMKEFGGTGVQQAINEAVFRALNMIVVYPVEDPNRFTDTKGQVLPDAYLVPYGTKVIDLAYMIHSELGKGFLYAIDAKSKKRLSRDYVLQDGDVIKIVSAL
ncbi:MAG TPA: redox-regulated ATPase YchF [Ignisphaera aggregans]|uniref:Redox-regulated ATPase YchF n=1 Tax=Ignisphaera aggregans TaxID=334771 RepID=A0A833DU47_9CREN|nr:redox-regulated ATPase YchF [Ignisphaera aggregans]